MPKLSAEIELTKGMTAIIDAEDLPLVSNYCWHVSHGGSGLYYVESSAKGSRKKVKLHRLVTNCPDGMEVDHRDRNPLNNRKNNLRVVTHKQNMENSKQALTTHCPLGHPYNEENTRLHTRKDGTGWVGRVCRKCASIKSLEWRAKMTEADREEENRKSKERYERTRERVLARQKAYLAKPENRAKRNEYLRLRNRRLKEQSQLA